MKLVSLVSWSVICDLRLPLLHYHSFSHVTSCQNAMWESKHWNKHSCKTPMWKIRIFWYRILHFQIEKKKTTHIIINKFRQIGSYLKEKCIKICWELAEERSDNTGVKLKYWSHNPLNTLHKKLQLEASGLKFQVCCVSDMNVNICITIRIISNIHCEAGKFYLWFTGLRARRLHWESKHTHWKRWHEELLFCSTRWKICSRLSNNLLVYTQIIGTP
jgi:hypothetical protein